ncbi:MAG: MFS transporter, partial [Elusimicrobia bacterium]|nr:MFS transporter [Elusimicrobiota bacterium]
MTPTADELRSNIPKAYWLNAAWMFLVLMPVIVPFYRSKGLSMTQVYELQSIFAVGMLVFEVPTGYIADMWGRRTALVLGSALHALGFLIYGLAGGFADLAAAEVVLAVGVSLFSGTDVALLYDSLAALEDRRAPIKLLGRLVYYRQMGEACGALVGGALVLVSMRCAVWANAAAACVPLLIAFTAVEPPRPLMGGKTHSENFRY